MINRIPEQELRQMYLDNQMSMREIAEKIGVSKPTVNRWMKKYGIESRTNSESLLINTLKPSKEELVEMYIYKEMSSHKISKKIGVSHGTVCDWMKEHGIEPRTCSESHLINTLKLSKEELQRMYWNEIMSMAEIAENVGVYSDTINMWMKEYGIKSRTLSESLTGKYVGKNASNWNGGASFEPYCNKFNNTFKEAIRERDDYTCQICRYEQKLNGRKLDVHHIHYDKENCYPDVVALCRSCHGKVDGDRDYWENFFENQLLERGLLDWSMN